jgi:hypothetical protein
MIDHRRRRRQEREKEQKVNAWVALFSFSRSSFFFDFFPSLRGGDSSSFSSYRHGKTLFF